MRFVDMVNAHGEPFLFSAIRSGNIYMTRWWLQIMHADPNAVYAEETALTLALRYKQPAIIDTLMRSPRMDLRLHTTRFLPECTAVTRCSAAIASLVLAHPTARVDATNHMGIPLVYLCIYYGLTGLVSLLLDRGATPPLRDPTDMTGQTLWTAILVHMPRGTFPILAAHPRLAPLFLRTGFGSSTSTGESLLELAVKKNDYDTVKYLMSVASWTQTRTATGEPFLWIAARNNHTLLWMYLLRYEAALRLQRAFRKRKRRN